MTGCILTLRVWTIPSLSGGVWEGRIRDRVCRSSALYSVTVGWLTVTGNNYYDQINSDKLAPPGTDNGATINAQWPMGMSLPCLDHGTPC